MRLKISHKNVTLKQISKAKEVALSKSNIFREKIESSHRFLMKKIEEGNPIYGITTGYGESGTNYVAEQNAYELQKNLYRYHGCGVGPKLDKDVSKYVVLIRLISLSKGNSGVSFELLERLEMLLTYDIIPLIPSQGSVGASGDLTPLSYVAAVIAGEREVYYKGKITSTKKVYEELGILPYVFKPKEALAIMNSTAVMSAIALRSLEEFEILLLSVESFVAAMYELLLCDITPLEPYVHAIKPFKGQMLCASKIKEKLEGSLLVYSQEQRYSTFFEDKTQNIQDHYSLRCAPQVLGVVRENLALAKKWVQVEINATSDNPIIDAQNERIYTSGNFYGGYIAHAMDTMKIAAANVADLLDKEFALLVDHKFNRGIGENLKLSKEPYHHGFKAMQITISSLSADVIKNTTAASIHSRPTESHNQDKVSMGTTAALDFSKMMPNLTYMLSIAFMGAAQGVDIRGKEKVSNFLLQNYTKLRKKVAPLYEDRAMDKDIKRVYKMIEKGKFV